MIEREGNGPRRQAFGYLRKAEPTGVVEVVAYVALKFERQSIESPSSSHISVGVSLQVSLALDETKRIHRQISRKLLSCNTQMLGHLFHHGIDFVHILRHEGYGHRGYFEERQEEMSNSGNRRACVVYIFVHETLGTRGLQIVQTRAFIKVT